MSTREVDMASSPSPLTPLAGSREGFLWRLPSVPAVLTTGLLLYVVVLFIAPVAPTIAVSGEAILMLCGYTGALFLGAFLGNIRVSQPGAQRWTTGNLGFDATAVLRWTALLATIGCLLRLVDRFVLRPGLVGSNIDVANQGSNAVGLVASLLYPLGIACLPLAFAIGTKRGLMQMLFLHALFFFSAIDVVLVGKRGAAITVLAMYAFVLVASGRLRLRLRAVLTTVTVGLTALLAFAWVFSRRVSGYGWSICDSLMNSLYSQIVRPAADVVASCQTQSFWSEPLQYLANFAIYYVHGIFEFSYAAPYYIQENQWSWGSYTFGILAKPACMLNISSCTAIDNTVRPGVYTTFWGPIFQDFGPWTALVALMLGFLIALVRQRALFSFGYVPLYSYLAVVAFFLPVVNLIQSGLGVYFLVAAFIFALVFEYQRKKHARQLRRSPRQDGPLFSRRTQPL